jgi:glycosyltransferase involved in cell wall biosynthesis
MDDIKVSVCMVTYNHERYIADAVESVLAQRRNFSLEVIIGEDCSTDRTRAIVTELAAKHPETIRLRLAEQNRGGKANFMDAFAACRGEYVHILEGDDYWISPDKLQRQVDALDSHPEWAICFHPTKCVWEDGAQGQSIYPLDWDRAEATIEDLFAANFIPTNAALFRNNLFGPLPSWFGELLLGDWPLHILNAAHGKIGFLPAVMSAYRIHRGGIWNGETPIGRNIEIFKMLATVDHHFGGKYSKSVEQYRVTTLRQIMSDADAAAARRDFVASELERKTASEAELQSHCNQLSKELVATLGQMQQLTERSREALEFHDAWRRTAAYRVYREGRRMLHKLAMLPKARRQRSAKHDPTVASTSSKAA